MSKTVPTITPDSISAVKGLEERPVYFLKLNNSAEWNLVVKMDAKNREATETTDDAAISIKWGSKLMRHVNGPEVKTKIMSPSEIEIFKNFALQFFDPTSEQYKNVGKQGPVFVKMPFVKGLTDADMWDEKGQKYAVTLAKKNVQKFSDEPLWMELGKVVAVDIFIGNNDRFDTSGTWVNKGNIMFIETGLTRRVIGLDTFDYNSANSNLKKKGTVDHLLILTNPDRRREFARKCALSVGAVIKSVLKKGGARNFTIRVQGPDGVQDTRCDIETMGTLFEPYAANFEVGLQIGADQLKQYLQDLVRKSKWVGVVPQQQGLPAQRPGLQIGQRPGLQIGQRQPGPQIGQGVQGPPPLFMNAPMPGQELPKYKVPQGILDRMEELGWQVV